MLTRREYLSLVFNADNARFHARFPRAGRVGHFGHKLVTNWVPNCLILYYMQKIKIYLISGWVMILLPSAHSATPITVRYSEAANIFEIMDNTSNWCPGFNDEAYEQFWRENLKITDEDTVLFKQYKKLRESHYNDPDQYEKSPLKNRNGFFSTIGSINADPLAEAFYSSTTLDEAFFKLKTLLPQEELAFLRGFYAHFSDRYSRLLSESRDFDKTVRTSMKAVNRVGVEKFLRNISTFYGVKDSVRYEVLFVWWPPISRSNATPSGNYLVMRLNPTRHANEDNTDVIFHEVVHAISARQDLNQKQKFTEEFLRICEVGAKLQKLKILEEPLAVANGQMLYQSRFQPKRFEHSSKWYNNAWISMFGKLLYPTVKSYSDARKSMDLDFIRKAAGMCAEIKSAAEMLAERPNLKH